MQKSIKLSKVQKQQLLDHAEKFIPNESCALLFGKTKDDEVTVEEIFLTKNIDNSPVNFTISNEELIKGYRTAEEKHLDVVGIFHSHPSSRAYPSSTDQKFMFSNPVIWIISSEKKDFKAYVLDSEILEIPIIIS